MFLINSLDVTNVHVSRGGEFEGAGSVWGWKLYNNRVPRRALKLLFTCSDIFAAGCIV